MELIALRIQQLVHQRKRNAIAPNLNRSSLSAKRSINAVAILARIKRNLNCIDNETNANEKCELKHRTSVSEQIIVS